MPVRYRDASAEDLGVVVQMYANDALGQTREHPSGPLPGAYMEALQQIDADPRHRLVVAEEEGEVVGTLQLSFLPHLVLGGGQRSQIEAVRGRLDRRGTGLGEALLRWAIERAQLRRCRLVQLTTNAERQDAQQSYGRLGFRPTHIGMKWILGTEKATDKRRPTRAAY